MTYKNQYRQKCENNSQTHHSQFKYFKKKKNRIDHLTSDHISKAAIGGFAAFTGLTKEEVSQKIKKNNDQAVAEGGYKYFAGMNANKEANKQWLQEM